MERRSALHLDRAARVMGQYEDRRVIRRLFAPPALPIIVRPFAARRPEHVAAHDPGADILESSCGEVVVDTGCPSALPVKPLERAGRNEPTVQLFTAPAERIFQILSGTGAVAIEGNAECRDSNLGHA